ncbi:MAG: hypothetical protein IJD94_01505 [Clostridia bacterium]|nr:hypothetical protein [Clostridia bacterium]
MKKMLYALLALALLVPCAAQANEWGTLFAPPDEVLEHIGDRWPDYELEDYCEIEDTPKGDFGFALLKSDDERLLMGYENKQGKMTYWLKNAGAVPQHDNPAVFSRIEEGMMVQGVFDESPRESDGLNFSVTVIDDNREAVQESVTYAWKDGGFRLTHYSSAIQWHCFVEDEYLHYWSLSHGDEGRVRGSVQDEIRYVSWYALPKTPEEAERKLSSAPDLPDGGFFHPQEIRFTGGQKYPVYTGPGKEYLRSGNGKGMVSTNDWIQVFGQLDDWIMIQYGISSDKFRIGWIEASALPEGAQVHQFHQAFRYYALEVSLETGYPNKVLTACELTDDPFMSETPIAKLEKGTSVVEVVYDYEGWSYVRTQVNGQEAFGFVPTDCIDHG